ncbi:unnamed protein product, partial [Ixodes pacificus]
MPISSPTTPQSSHGTPIRNASGVNITCFQSWHTSTVMKSMLMTAPAQLSKLFRKAMKARKLTRLATMFPMMRSPTTAPLEAASRTFFSSLRANSHTAFCIFI